MARLASLALALGAAGCVHRGPSPAPPEPPVLSTAQIAELIPAHVKDRQGWAADVEGSLLDNHFRPQRENVCAVLAVIEQESNFQEDPAVPGLSKLVREHLDAQTDKLGPLGKPALHALLKDKAPGNALTFEERLDRVRTEGDLDRIFRDLIASFEAQHPATFGLANLLGRLVASKRVEDFNPITTSGSMQVSVRYATELAHQRHQATEGIREALYTRRGGVHFGTARLLGYDAAYDQPIYRFADYNAGFYSSRNAALQAQLNQLTGASLQTDGDLRAYDAAGEPIDRTTKSLEALLLFRARFAPQLSERRIRSDLTHEKERDFDETETFKTVKRVFAERTGRAAPYAQVPEVVISSPKMKRERSTAWFARTVDRRYQGFLARTPTPVR